jgi:hypothetical protein
MRDGGNRASILQGILIARNLLCVIPNKCEESFQHLDEAFLVLAIRLKIRHAEHRKKDFSLSVEMTRGASSAELFHEIRWDMVLYCGVIIRQRFAT